MRWPLIATGGALAVTVMAHTVLWVWRRRRCGLPSLVILGVLYGVYFWPALQEPSDHYPSSQWVWAVVSVLLAARVLERAGRGRHRSVVAPDAAPLPLQWAPVAVVGSALLLSLLLDRRVAGLVATPIAACAALAIAVGPGLPGLIKAIAANVSVRITRLAAWLATSISRYSVRVATLFSAARKVIAVMTDRVNRSTREHTDRLWVQRAEEERTVSGDRLHKSSPRD